MTETQILDLMDELESEFAVPPLAENDVTAERLAKRLGYTVRGTQSLLHAKVVRGELVVVKKRGNQNKTVNAYVKPQDIR